MLESGYRISDLKSIPLTGENCKFKNKIALDNTFLLGYAHTVYGTTYNKHNYKIPLGDVRDDIKGYIGVESLVAPWSEQLKLWHGSWDNKAEYNKSYVWEWEPKYYNHEHYNPEKFTDLENSYYIIKDAPFPYETGELNNRDRGEIAAKTNPDGSPDSINLPIAAADKHPDSNKIVTKSYIDERIASKRIVEVTTDFWIRDYDCVYIIRAPEVQKLESEESPTIKVHFSKDIDKRALHNKLAFSIFIEGVEGTTTKWVPPISKNLNWEFYNFNNELINTIWLNNASNKPEDITKQILFDNSRYCVFDIEVVNDEIKSVENKDTVTWKQIGNLSVFITCINSLYRLKGSIEVNEIENVISLLIKSEDKSITISNIKEEIVEEEDDKTYAKAIIDLKANLIGKNGIEILQPYGENTHWSIGPRDDTFIGDSFINIDYVNIGEENNEKGQFRFSFDPNGLDLGEDNIPIEGDEYINVNYDDEPGTCKLSFNVDALDIGEANIPIEGDKYINVDYNSEPEKCKLTFNVDELDLGDSVKQYIKSIPSDGIINISDHNSVYFTNNNNLNISFNTSGLEPQQTITTVIYFKFSETAAPKVTATPNETVVKWVKSENNIAPKLIANRLYRLSFTYLPPIEVLNEPAQLIGQIDWFRY